jgi:hypothetical protein
MARIDHFHGLAQMFRRARGMRFAQVRITELRNRDVGPGNHAQKADAAKTDKKYNPKLVHDSYLQYTMLWTHANRKSYLAWLIRTKISASNVIMPFEDIWG